MHRYLAEFDFYRASLGVNDEMQAERAIKGTKGKRLTYINLVGRNRLKQQLKHLHELLNLIDSNR